MMELRVIEQDAQDLPAHFAVVPGKTAAEGIANIAQAFTRPGVNLVVWNEAANLVREKEKALVRAAMEGTAAARIPWFRSERPPSFNRRAHLKEITSRFNEAACAFAGAQEPNALASWRRSARDITSALVRTFGIGGIWTDIRPETDLGEERFHQDRLVPDQGLILRTAYGHAAVFAENADIKKKRGYNVRILSPAATRLWTVRPWAVVMLANAPSVTECLHSKPYDALFGTSGARRVLEITGFRTSGPIMPQPGPRF